VIICKRKLILLCCTLVPILFGGILEIQALELGGNMEMNSGLNYPLADKVLATYYGYGELELFLPTTDKNEPRLVLQGLLASNGDSRLGIKYMYLRRKQNWGNITIGRQPISWAYGSLINPLDFGFGIDDLAMQTITPGADGLSFFRPFGNRKSMQFVLSWRHAHTAEPIKLDLGARLRMPRQGYDLSLNLAHQHYILGTSEDELFRSGLTYSSDLNKLGIYGALGYNRLLQSGEEDLVVQIGFDHSWMMGRYERKMAFLQVEYLRFVFDNLNLSTLAALSSPLDAGDSGMSPGFAAINSMMQANDLLIINLNIQLDSFTSLGSAFMLETSDLNIILTPYYLVDLGGELELRLDASLMLDEDQELSTGAFAGITYYF